MNSFSLLARKRFLPLFITQFLGAFNDNTFKNALIILITYRLAAIDGLNAQLLVTIAAGIFILPFFLFSATAGQLADKYEKSRLIKTIKFIEILIMSAAALGFYSQSPLLLMTVLFALGTHATFFGPLKYALLPEQLQPTELLAGNGLIEAGTFIAILIGTIIGGVLILQNHGDAIISGLIIFIAIVGWIASWSIPKTEHANPSIKMRFNIWRETRELMQYPKKHGTLFLTILGISWFWLIGATFLAEFPVFAKDSLHAGEAIVTLFFTLFSIGLALGSLLCNRLLKGQIHATYVPLGAVGMTLFTLDLYFAAGHFSHLQGLMTLQEFLFHFHGWRICVDLLLIAAAGGIYTVPLYAILQQRADKAHRARVIACNNVMNALFMVAAAIITLVLLALGCSVTQVFLLIAISNGLVAIYICKLLPDVFIRGFFHRLLTLLFRVKVKGLDNYHAAGKRVVIIANHTSFIDPLLLSIFLPDKLTFAVNTLIAKKWWIRLFIRMVPTFSLDPTNPMAIKSLIEFVEQNKRCVIFPEGRLTMTGALMKIYEGPGLIADKAAAPLLPIRIDGAQFTPFSRLRGKVRIQWLPQITITIFPAEQITIAPEVKGRLRRQQISLQLYDVMTNVIFHSSDYQKTLFDSLLDARVLHGPHHEIMEDIERTPLHYQALIRHCFILGGVLAKNSQAGEVIGVLLPNMNVTVVTFFALQAFCRVPAMLNYSTDITHVLTACQAAKITTIYSSLKFVRFAKLTHLVSGLTKAGINVIYLEHCRADMGLYAKVKGSLYAQWPRLAYRFLNRAKPRLRSPDTAAVILFTSSSEGSPKGVVLSHTNFQANRHQLSACIDFTANDKVFNALPLFHSFGLTSSTLLPLLSGVKVFLYPSPLHYRIVPELVYDTNATILFGTDTFLSGYAKFAHPYDFYSIRYVFAGAEKLRADTAQLWSLKFGLRIFEGYGATETAPVISINTPMQHKHGTVGRLLPGINHRITPVPGIEDGGSLAIQGPNIMKGYLFADQPGVLIAPTDGWYETGDIVSIDDEGFITMKGRLNRFATINGHKVSLALIEQYLNELWPEGEHAVLSVPDQQGDEQLLLITTHAEARMEAFALYAKEKALTTLPQEIIFVKELPRLGSGKVDYTRLTTAYL